MAIGNSYKTVLCIDKDNSIVRVVTMASRRILATGVLYSRRNCAIHKAKGYPSDSLNSVQRLLRPPVPIHGLWTFFPFHRNCTSRSRKTGGSENSTVDVIRQLGQLGIVHTK